MHQCIGSALVQIMACRLSAPNHYLNQCWVIVNWCRMNKLQWNINLMNKLQWNINQNTKLFSHEIASENIICEMTAIFSSGWDELTHWGWVTHICVSKLTSIGSENGLSSGRRQAIIWTNAGILLMWTLGTNFSEILREIHAFHSRKCIWKCRLRSGVHFVSAWMRQPRVISLIEGSSVSPYWQPDMSGPSW